MEKTLPQRLVALHVQATTDCIRGMEPQNSGINFFGTFLGALAIFAVGLVFWMVTP